MAVSVGLVWNWNVRWGACQQVLFAVSSVGVSGRFPGMSACAWTCRKPGHGEDTHFVSILRKTPVNKCKAHFPGVETKRAQLQRHKGSGKGRRVSSWAGKRGTAPPPPPVQMRSEWAGSHAPGSRPAVRVSRCGSEPVSLPAAWLATASWEAGGSPARPGEARSCVRFGRAWE